MASVKLCLFCNEEGDPDVVGETFVKDCMVVHQYCLVRLLGSWSIFINVVCSTSPLVWPRRVTRLMVSVGSGFRTFIKNCAVGIVSSAVVA